MMKTTAHTHPTSKRYGTTTYCCTTPSCTPQLYQSKIVLAFFGSLIIWLLCELSFYKSAFNITLLHSKFVSKYLIRKTYVYLMTLRRNLLKSLYPKIHELDSPNKGDQSWVFTGRTDAEAETPILWPPDVKS